ncbi:Mitotic spindle checkpoint component mad3 [Sesamum angolense]|uniref:Mitotic spindle checkpoint component mad3 n=1 Tax=Sesamum angolense TaxID=2727404 RepID=A0AAE1W249_9LAMI|nr:Mitotic spindle checkpoint component mad3 [Sesamum angolense]
MSNNGNTLYNNLFSSLISDIKSYNGIDPLLPWLRGIRKMKETLPPQLLKEKLPRFLQKCSVTFLTDRRYSNDLRYLRVWLQLMDFVDDPKAILKTMEMNRIGMKKSLFYQAYALYYEKMKKFDAAEKIYHLGVQNLAEPADELQKSFEQFLSRKTNSGVLNHQVRGCKEDSRRAQGQTAQIWHEQNLPETQAKFVNNHNKIAPSQSFQTAMPMREANHNHMAAKSCNVGLLSDQLPRKLVVSDSGVNVKLEEDENQRFCSDDTVVVKFVDTAIVGKSNTEDARHHGLVEPTINTKEAMNAINSMFREPLEPSIAGRTRRNQREKMHQGPNLRELMRISLDKSFEIYVDSEETNDVKEKVNENGIQAHKASSFSRNSVFAKPDNHPSECFKDPKARSVHQAGPREDTVVYRFVGSTISDEPEVENVWHHGLVDPTINFKEAMKDINSMFGKPIEFVRKSRLKKHDRAPDVKNNCEEFLILPDDDEPDNTNVEDDIGCMFQKPLGFEMRCNPRNLDKEPDVMNNQAGFLILPDDELDNQQDSSLPSSSTRNGNDLFEQTLCTKEAMAEINKLFAMPMDF